MASRYLLGKRGRLGERERERVHAGCTVTHTHTHTGNNKQTGRPDECRLDSSVFSSPLCIPHSSLRYNEAALISAGMRVFAGAGTRWWLPNVRPTRAGLLSWLTPQVMT